MSSKTYVLLNCRCGRSYQSLDGRMPECLRCMAARILDSYQAEKQVTNGELYRQLRGSWFSRLMRRIGVTR